MKFLLDTHVWLWSLLAPNNLGASTQTTLTDPQHSLWPSPISVWETLVLIEKVRLQVDRAPDPWVEYALQQSPVREAPLTHAVARRSRQIPLPHKDPADRFIAATALEYDLTLMTADGYLLQSSALNVWAAT